MQARAFAFGAAAAYLDRADRPMRWTTSTTIAADPNMADAYHSMRGLIYMRMNEMGDWLGRVSSALSLNPRSGFGFFGKLQVAVVSNQALCRIGTNVLRLPWPIQTWRAPRRGWRRAIANNVQAARAEAEASLMRALRARCCNPIVAYNLSLLLFQRGDLVRAQFYDATTEQQRVWLIRSRCGWASGGNAVSGKPGGDGPAWCAVENDLHSRVKRGGI